MGRQIATSRDDTHGASRRTPTNNTNTDRQHARALQEILNQRRPTEQLGAARAYLNVEITRLHICMHQIGLPRKHPDDLSDIRQRVQHCVRLVCKLGVRVLAMLLGVIVEGVHQTPLGEAVEQLHS